MIATTVVLNATSRLLWDDSAASGRSGHAAIGHANRLRLVNVTGATTVMLGGAIAAVNATVGHPWTVADGPLSLRVPGGDTLAGACVGTQTISILRTVD